MKVRITRYPNNETRISVYPERRPLPCWDGTSNEHGAIAEQASTSTSVPLSSFSSECTPSDIGTLDIKFKLETPLRKRRISLSRYGHRRLIRAGACFSQGKDSVRLLLTGTLPGSTREAFRVLADNSSYVTHRLCNWLTRRQRSAKWLYAWEFQKRGALHLHLAIEVSVENAEFIKREFKHEWNRLLNTIGNRNDVDMWAKSKTYSHSQETTQTDVTICEKEPSRYIAKYIAKGNAKSFGPNRFPPVRWYQISRALLRDLEDKTEVYEREALSFGQARAFVEVASHNLYHYQLCGSREFRGVIYAWSGYGYGEDFQIEDYGDNFVMVCRTINNARTIATRLSRLSENYPQMRCYMHSGGYSDLLAKVKMGTTTPAETDLFIRKAMDVAMLAYDRCVNKRYVSRVMLDTALWMGITQAGNPLTDDFMNELVKNCEESLTG